MKEADEKNGVWRTVGGRRIFIQKGESLTNAMKRSGKFKKENKSQENKSKSYSKAYQSAWEELQFLREQDPHELSVPDDFENLANVDLPKEDEYWSILNKILNEEQKSPGIYYSNREVLSELHKYLKKKLR